jgi:hypothetical protein
MPYDEKIIDKVDKITLFWYIVIIIVVMVVFSRMKIGLNILVGIIISIMIIYVMYNDYSVVQNNAQELFNQKTKLIYPAPKETIKHDRMINFLFSIQDFYVHNPQAYEDMREHIDYFFKLNNEVMKNSEIAGSNYQLMQDQKHNALNSLQSILYRIPFHKEYDQKLQLSIVTLREILDGYISVVYQTYKEELYKTGYSINTKTIEKGPAGYQHGELTDPYYNTYDLF